MAYTSNPHIGKTRRKAVQDVYNGSSVAVVARYYGVHRTTVWRWVKRSSTHPTEYHKTLDTRSSAPLRCAKRISCSLVSRIVSLRQERNRCAPILHAQLSNEGVRVSLSTVERTLRREGLVRKKKRRASFYRSSPRPVSDRPGALVQVDTVHFTRPNNSRYYIVTVLDTFSRLAYAYYTPKLTQGVSVKVIQQAQSYFGFSFSMVQTDNGPEFKDYVMQRLGDLNIAMRHSRVRKPNDNAHLERFNRTIQEECFDSRNPDELTAQSDIDRYLEYYNYHRLHLGLQCQTPRQFVAKVMT